MEWKSIAIPKRMYDNIKKVIVYTGHPSVSESWQLTFFKKREAASLNYVREKVNRHLTTDMFKADEFKEHLEELKDQ